MTRKLAITGCNGSVGKAVVRAALASSNWDEVLGIDMQDQPSPEHPVQDKFVYRQLDLRTHSNVLDVLAGCSAVIHLAGIPGPGDYQVDTHNSNVVLSWNVMRACAELNINRLAQASSVNVLRGVYAKTSQLHYVPIDENHPCEPDEPYGLSKVIAETQAAGLCRRYPDLRIASIRPHWSVKSAETILNHPDSSLSQSGRRSSDLWGWVHEDSLADAFMRAIVDGIPEGGTGFKGHEAFFIAAPTTILVSETSDELVKEYHANLEIRAPFNGSMGFYDCSKAERMLGWVHKGH